MAGLHGVEAATLGLGTQVGRVAEHAGEGHECRDLLDTAIACLHGLDLAAAGVEVANDVAHVLLRDNGNDLHHRLGEDGISLSHSLLEGHGAGDLERHLRRVDLMVGTVVQGNLHVNDVVAGQNTGLHSALDTVVNSGDVLLGNSTAHDSVDELVALTGLVGLDGDLDVTVLTGATGLTLVLGILIDCLADGLLVGDLGLTDVSLHLEIIVDRLLREFKVEANIGKPQVAYKETVRAKVDHECKYKKQSGGSGQYGHVKLILEPNEPGKGYEFINAVTGGAIPKEFIEPVNQGIQGAMQNGVLAGYNVVDVKVTLYDGSYHEVDSSEMAFKIAGSMAFKEAMRKANPVLTEPIVKVVTITPDDYLGDIIGDFNSRRGQIQSMEPGLGVTEILAFVPLSEMFGYATDLRSKSQGRAQYSMEPSHFAEVPKSIQEGIISARSKNN